MRVGLDAGHCRWGADTGAQGNGMKEELMTRAIANEVSKQLQSLGHAITICNIDKSNSVSESLRHRYSTANNAGVDMFVSIHINAGGGKGSEIYTFGGQKLNEATRTLSNLNSLGFVNRGVKDGSRLSVIRNTSMKSMLIEVCFIDTKSDVDLYNSIGAKRIADAIVSGILGKSMDKPQAPKPSTPTTSKGTVYTVQVGAYRDKSNADAKQKELKSKGIDCFIATK